MDSSHIKTKLDNPNISTITKAVDESRLSTIEVKQTKSELNNNNITKDKENESKSNSQIKRFEIQKDSCLTYNPTTNYYQEYWKMFYDNEYLLAQIKENAYEISSMKAHVEKISKGNAI